MPCNAMGMPYNTRLPKGRFLAVLIRILMPMNNLTFN
jgi:hypothetical protein